MTFWRENRPNMRARPARTPNSRHRRRQVTKARRSLIRKNPDRPFDPTEDWYEPSGQPGYRVIVKPAGPGYRHVVTAEQVRSRLALLPPRFLRDLQVVQLATMTRKKHRFPCYGLQWGTAIYLYPFDENLEEEFDRPPPRSLVVEARMYGGRFQQVEPGLWKLRWTESAARDFCLNNVLIHELGHLVDLRNTTYTDQERYAEWFAVEYGYLRSGGAAKRSRQPGRRKRRRHHC